MAAELYNQLNSKQTQGEEQNGKQDEHLCQCVFYDLYQFHIFENWRHAVFLTHCLARWE